MIAIFNRRYPCAPVRRRLPHYDAPLLSEVKLPHGGDTRAPWKPRPMSARHVKAAA
jgi:hypothetical protein